MTFPHGHHPVHQPHPWKGDGSSSQQETSLMTPEAFLWSRNQLWIIIQPVLRNLKFYHTSHSGKGVLSQHPPKPPQGVFGCFVSWQQQAELSGTQTTTQLTTWYKVTPWLLGALWNAVALVTGISNDCHFQA